MSARLAGWVRPETRPCLAEQQLQAAARSPVASLPSLCRAKNDGQMRRDSTVFFSEDFNCLLGSHLLRTSRLHRLPGIQTEPDSDLQRSAKTVEFSPNSDRAGSHMNRWIQVSAPGAHTLPAGAVPCSLNVHLAFQRAYNQQGRCSSPCSYSLMPGIII